jgi:hypothetical protein
MRRTKTGRFSRKHITVCTTPQAAQNLVNGPADIHGMPFVSLIFFVLFVAITLVADLPSCISRGIFPGRFS